jgi:Predicted membrane protein (DUF2207)
VQWWPRVLATVAAVVVAGLGLAVLAAPARAQPAERILDYTVDVEIEAAGSLLVTEQIAYDFGTQERHGIFREVPVRFRYDDRQDRIYPLEVLGVWTSVQTPGQYTLEEVDNALRIRIGHPDQLISGQHDYRILYRVEGTLNGFVDHDELYWNAIGADWEVPIEQASVRVRAPAAIGQVACYVGPVGATRACPASEPDGQSVTFGPSGLTPNQGPDRGRGVPDRGGAGPPAGPCRTLEPGPGVLGDPGHPGDGRWGPGGRAGGAGLAVGGQRARPPAS